MKRFFAFVKKEFLHIFRDVRTLTILIGLPVVLVIIFGYIVSNEIKNAKIAFLDYSNDNVTQQLKNDILASGYFIEENCFKLANDNKTVADKNNSFMSNAYSGDIDAAFKDGKVLMVIVFQEDFAEKIEREGIANMQIIADASDPNTATILIGYIQAIVEDFQRSMFFEGRESMEIVVEPRMMFNNELKGAYMYVPGTIAFILMLICAIMTSVSITREKEFGSMEVLLVTPLKSSQLILGKLVPYVFLSVICSAIIFLLGYFLFGVPFRGSVFDVVILTLCFVIIALLLGLWVSNFTKTMEIAMTLSLVVLMLPTLLLSGFIFPLENMPMFLQIIADILPAKYYLDAIKTIMLKGGGLMDVIKDFSILLVMIIVLVFVNIKSIKDRLD
ncbi:MAG: ABC transporter permease [Bacteroidales bacterium]|jgi:ABC-2 type transport system permease protein|nr:ABC transporter permease [Bacteroidales bacterium]MDD2204422.1 ABC transporter permease [Bacteroidales bacterium]MDD3152532.1 ABC transporter permease [Bacteroidales bacterium]MDD3913992.1 ABC transporter permease [Bacteroidales bacterium]MDD4633784.1 ABC transporter permease [Bacteroidales bacterium]